MYDNILGFVVLLACVLVGVGTMIMLASQTDKATVVCVNGIEHWKISDTMMPRIDDYGRYNTCDAASPQN